MIVMVFGTFDILHSGHLNFFKQARRIAKRVAAGFSLRKKGVVNFSKRSPLPKRGNGTGRSGDPDFMSGSLRPELIVVVARDINVKKEKGHLPKFSEKIRSKNIKKLRIVDRVILGNKKDYFKVIKNKKPDVICLGYDQKMKVLALKKKLKKAGLIKTKVYRLKAYKPKIYKSSLLSDI